MPLPSWLQSPSPTLGIAIDGRRVTAVVARPGAPAQVEAHAVVALPPEALQPSLTAPNVLQRDVVSAAVRRAVEHVGGRHKRCALVLPDTVAKVTLLRFEQPPAQARDLEQLIRLQLRKALPFPVEQAQVSIVDGRVDADGHEYLAVAARQDIVAAYESVCADAGLHAGTVDLATFNVINAVLLGDAAGSGASGDWLLVQVGSDYSSLAIVRDGLVIFYRTRPSDADEDLADVVHQTRMYFEDRLAGQGFARVLLADGADSRATAQLARDIESRLGATVQSVDLRRTASLGPRVSSADGDAMVALAAPAGAVLREF